MDPKTFGWKYIFVIPHYKCNSEIFFQNKEIMPLGMMVWWYVVVSFKLLYDDIFVDIVSIEKVAKKKKFKERNEKMFDTTFYII